MNQAQADLIAKVEAFELDDPRAADPFSERLARENGWSELHVRCVIREYKRFLVLAVTAPHLVTPSEQVDQAWHLHLLYSACYREFCSRVLGRTLDHGPGNGAGAERKRFTLAYDRTLASYSELFGEAAPGDVWPSRPNSLWSRCSWLAILCLVGCFFACSGSEFFLGYLVLWALLLRLAFTEKRLMAARGAAQGPVPTLEPYELLQLARGPQVAVDGALVVLLAKRALIFVEQPNAFRIIGALPEDATDLERRIYREIGQSRDRSATLLRAKALQLTSEITARLEALALMTSGREEIPRLIALVAPYLVVIRVLIRLARHESSSGLVVLCLGSALLACLLVSRAERTALGDRVLESARSANRGTSASELSHLGRVPMSIALHGIAAVDLSAAASFTRWLTLPYSSD